MTGRISPLHQSHYLLFLLALTMLWPAIVNGGAFYFPDTSAYIRGVDAAFGRAFGWNSAWTQTNGTMITGPSHARTALSVLPHHIEAKPVLLGRSPYYGIIPYLGVVLASSDWPTLLIQALLAGMASIGITRHLVAPQQRSFGWTCATCFAMLNITPLPFFVCMLMPDFMAGIGIIAAAALIVGWQRERSIWRLIWFALIVAAALMHSANILILVCIAICTLIYAVSMRNRAVFLGGAAVLLAAAMGFTGEAAFTHAVTRLTGTAPIRPPFVVARLIEDGPGLAYLDRSCPTSGFLLCRFRSRMPYGSDTFLWSSEPSNGVFTVSSPAAQRALSAEQGRFVWAVISTYPAQSATSMLRAIGRQIGLLSLVEFNYPRNGDLDRIPQIIKQSIVSTRAHRRTMPVIPESLLWIMTIISLVIISGAVLVPTTKPVAGYGGLVALGWLANDVVCGALSTPHDRYQARVIWILPLIAGLLVLRWCNARRISPEQIQIDSCADSAAPQHSAGTLSL